MKSLKKTLIIIGLMNVVIMVVFIYFINSLQPVPIPVTLQNIAMSSVYSNNNFKEIESKGWKGYRFKGSLRVLYKDMETNPTTIDQLIKSSFTKTRMAREISLYDRGTYILKKKNKGYILTAIFQKGNRVFWIDSVSNSTLDVKQTLFHQLLTNLVINNQPVSNQLSVQLAEIKSQTPILIIQSMEVFFIFFNGILILVLGIVYVVFNFMTASPFSGKTGVYRIGSRDVSFSYTGRLKKWTPVYLCRNNDMLEFYRFKKLILSFDLGKVQAPVIRKRKLLIFKEITLRISDEDIRTFHLEALIQQNHR